MNATVQAFIEALPKRKALTPVELAGVFGKSDGRIIISEIQRGRIAACQPGGQFFISYDEAVRYIKSTEYKPQEA